MDGAVVRRWCRLAADALGSARSAIDALNVYPVPDSDTGTNLYRTLRSAADAVDALAPGTGPEEVWRAAADGAMLGACGNSGIIVSQLLRGLADVCAPASPCDGAVVATALGHAAGLARAAVSRPAEGTVLTVADAAARAAAAAVADAAQAAAMAVAATAAGAAAPHGTAPLGVVPHGTAPLSAARLAVVVLAAGAAARQARDLTTGQLAALAASGVVDAGAAGLCVILDAWAAAISGTQLAALDVPEPATPPAAEAPAAAGPAQSYGYEVTYLLQAARDEVAQLREQLDSMGDSLVIAGGPADAPGPASTPSLPSTASRAEAASDVQEAAVLAQAGRLALWSVHVHVPEAGAAIEAGLRAGSLRRITVTYLGAPPPPAPGPGHLRHARHGRAGRVGRRTPTSFRIVFPGRRRGQRAHPAGRRGGAAVHRGAQRRVHRRGGRWSRSRAGRRRHRRPGRGRGLAAPGAAGARRA